MKELNSYLQTALKATREVSTYLSQAFYKNPSLIRKERQHFGTHADKKASNIYQEIFKTETPKIGIFDEEGRRDLNQNLTWVIDPLDGTTNFCTGIPFFATQVALIHNQEVILGIICLPMANQLCYAIKGGGAFLDDKPIHVNHGQNIKEALLLIGKGHGDDGLNFVRQMIKISGENMRNYRIYGATGAELVLVAQGKADLLCNAASELYDYAPGAIIIQEAGGVTCNLNNKPWSMQNRSLVAGNINLVKKLLSLINK